MKYSILIILVILTTTFSFSQEQINWKDTIKEGISLAEKQNKDVLIYFGMDKCVPCRMLNKYAFTKEEFIEYSKKYIMVKVYDDLDKENVENQEYVKSTRAEYQIEAVPTIVILNKDGSQHSFFAYVKSPQELIDQIEAL
ncbi:thioredoxin family protein [Bizionia argentinensis JUB59]|uniref:Thioredoxin family protein n=1 Tax=Bizionia argentinensis JUB59 TaxID=1046627 RepID=A0A4U8UIW8_9FLAO|nr:thioredoxin family protein [Bizionia argentinensis]TLG99052.1 thioredoxin family protein [Bizionia argentinensis JUB59]